MKKIIKGIQSSIKKWERVKKDIIERKVISYSLGYWNECGYCRVFENCEECPLSGKSRKYKVSYCCLQGAGTVAHSVLVCADNGRWDSALGYINILLAKMKRDLKKYEKQRGIR